MPTNSSVASTKQQKETPPQSDRSGIGINAVAAASICKSYGRTRRVQDASKPAFLFNEGEFATD